MKNLSLFLFIALFSSCTKVMFLAYGISKPKVITQEKVERHILKYELKSEYSLAISDTGYHKYMLQGLDINEIFLYTKDGKLVLPEDTNSCSSASFDFIDVFRDTNYAYLRDTNSMNAFHPYFRNLDGSPCVLENNKPYTAVVFWASWAGRLNKDLSAKWVEQLKKHEDVTVVCVSLDMRDFWPNTEK